MERSAAVFLAVPVILIVALGVIFFTSQPKVSPDEAAKTIEVNGDEYDSEEYSMGDLPAGREPGPKAGDLDYFIPERLGDCLNRPAETRDTCYITYTAISGDPAGCNSIADITDRSDCFARVAEVTGDKAFCENVRFGTSECYVGVAINTGDAALCPWGDYERRQCYEAYKTGNTSNCVEGDDRRFCIQAIFDKNVDMCANIRVFDSFCYYNVAVDTNSASLCNKIKPDLPYAKDNCFFRVALETNNPALCENLAETRDSCVAWIAYNTGNKELCYKAGAEAQSCIEDLSG